MREAIKASTNWEHGDNLKKKTAIQSVQCSLSYFTLFMTLLAKIASAI